MVVQDVQSAFRNRAAHQMCVHAIIVDMEKFQHTCRTDALDALGVENDQSVKNRRIVRIVCTGALQLFWNMDVLGVMNAIRNRLLKKSIAFMEKFNLTDMKDVENYRNVQILIA